MKKGFLLVILLAVLVGFAPTADATTLEFELDYLLTGSGEPEGPTPWLTATFSDEGVDPGVVRLTMEATNLIDKEFVSEWDFNFDLDASYLSCAYVTGVEYSSIKIGNDSVGNTAGTGFYDIQFLFPTSNGPERFTAGETSVFDFTYSGSGVFTPNSFYAWSTGGGNGSWPTIAHVQGIGPDDANSGWIVSEPASMLLLGTGLFVLAGLSRKRFR